MTDAGGSLFSDVARQSEDERFDTLLDRPGVRIERIVSTGQASPLGFWYDQDRTEWVMVVSGAAAILFEGEAEPHALSPGDYLTIPPGCRHRVAWTSVDEPTIWLAVHIGEETP